MSTQTVSRSLRLAVLSRGFCMLAFGASPAWAEIILLDNGGVVSSDAYAYEHPTMRSVVFSSPQARAAAIIPIAPNYVMAQPMLMRSPVPYIAYPPVIYSAGINNPVRPSNRDNVTYSLARAHAFGQAFYDPGSYAGSAAPMLYAAPYAYGYGIMPYYPPANPRPGFNQPARPSNRDNTTYNLDRAHRFSMDAYRKP